MLDFNEGKVCDAIIRCLEERTTCSRTDMRWPEQEQHQAPIEVAFSLGNQLFALEHTGIEPFAGHVEIENRAKNLYMPITDALKDALGTTALSELYIPINAFQNKKKLDIKNIQNALIGWVKKTAPTMLQHSDGKGTHVGPTDVSEVPFKVALVRFEPPPLPRLYFQIRHEAKDLNKLRAKRMLKAIEDKFPKLAQWKTKDNARTILVLEANDVQLTAPDIVADTFVPLAKARADRPDETYLVGTFMTPSWCVWPILIDDKTYLDIARGDEPEHWEFDPAKLEEFTLRETANVAPTVPILDAYTPRRRGEFKLACHLSRRYHEWAGARESPYGRESRRPRQSSQFPGNGGNPTPPAARCRQGPAGQGGRDSTGQGRDAKSPGR